MLRRVRLRLCSHPPTVAADAANKAAGRLPAAPKRPRRNSQRRQHFRLTQHHARAGVPVALLTGRNADRRQSIERLGAVLKRVRVDDDVTVTDRIRNGCRPGSASP